MRVDTLKNLRVLVAMGGLLLGTTTTTFAAETPAPASTSVASAADSDSELGESGSANVLERYFSAQVDAAKEEKKTLILAVFNSFAHSELSKVLLHTPEWKERVAGKYVIMPLDLRPTLLENHEYATMVHDIIEKFPVKSVPGMIFFDADLQPAAQIHGQTTKEGFLSTLDKVEAAATKRSELIAKRKGLKAEEAKLADQLIDASLALDTPPESLRDAIDDVLELDADGTAGLKAKYQPIARILQAEALMQKNSAETAAMAEQTLNAVDATKLAPAWQERRMALLLDAILVGGDTAKIEPALTAALAMDGVQPEIKQAWIARTAGAFHSRGDTTRAEELVKKAMALAPQSAWAKSVSKLAGEYYSLVFHRSGWVPVVVARPHNNYGPREHFAGTKGEVIPRFILQSFKNQPLTIYGDGSQTRDFTYVRDTVEMLVYLLANDQALGEVFNVCFGAETSILELGRQIVKLTGSKSEFQYLPGRPSDVLRLYGDNEKLRRLLGFTPKTQLAQGLLQTVEYFRGLAHVTPKLSDRAWEENAAENWLT